MRDRDVFRVLRAQASAQAGCVSREALMGAGVSPAQVETLRRRGALVDLVRGLYAFGLEELSPHALWWAGLLAGGSGARLGYRSALEAHRLLPPSTRHATVVIPRRNGHGTRRLHPTLPAADGGRATITIIQTRRPGPAHVRDGVWADDLLRAMDDLGACGVTSALRKAWREGDYLGMLGEERVEQHLRSASVGSTAVRELRRQAPPIGEGVELLSRAEYRFLEALLRAGGGVPTVNGLVQFGNRMLQPDFWFAAEQVVVEVDGPGHERPSRKAADAERDTHLRACGVEVLRYPDGEVRADADACVAAVVERLIARRAEIAARNGAGLTSAE